MREKPLHFHMNQPRRKEGPTIPNVRGEKNGRCRHKPVTEMDETLENAATIGIKCKESRRLKRGSTWKIGGDGCALPVSKSSKVPSTPGAVRINQMYRSFFSTSAERGES